jgi:hypothetical protein
MMMLVMMMMMAVLGRYTTHDNPQCLLVES